MELKATHYAGIAGACVALLVAFIFFFGTPYFGFILVVGLIGGSLPFVINFLVEQKKQQEKEEMFLEFSKDLVENVKSGTPVSKGIMNLRKRNYGSLSPHIAKMANQLNMGITLNSALLTFAKESKSKVISRAVGLISEAERAGGSIESVLESVAKSVQQIDNLNKERKSSVFNLIVQGYIIFVVFIIIMLVLEFKILPMVSEIGGIDAGGGGGQLGGFGGGGGGKIDPEKFSTPLFSMVLVQAFFAGLVIGKISEGSLKGGIKHSFILLAITMTVTTGARAIFGDPGEAAKDVVELVLGLIGIG